MDAVQRLASSIYTDIHWKIRRDMDTDLEKFSRKETVRPPHAFSDKPYADHIKFNLSILEPATFVLYVGETIRILYDKNDKYGYIVEYTDSLGEHALHTSDWRKVESSVDAHFA